MNKFSLINSLYINSLINIKIIIFYKKKQFIYHSASIFNSRVSMVELFLLNNQW